MIDETTDITAETLAARFKATDYVIFSLLLAVSAGIGIFFGFFGKKMDTKEFLMAGKSMGTFPVAMSLIASFMSAITLLGTPSEVYQTGFTYWLIGFSYFLVLPASAYLYLPVFWKLEVTSAYEYLEIRFGKSVRRLGSCLFIFQMSLYMAIVVYAPALALSHVTGLNVYGSVCAICIVCIFYTTIGGMKAVLWTDTIQVVIMYSSMVFIILKGTFDQGGFTAVWEAGTRGNRTMLVDFDPSPISRHTFWTLIFGGYFTWITIYGTNQAQIQRYLCVRKKYMAVRALWINFIGLFVLMVICAFGGLVIYKRYEGCDPVKSGFVTKYDQLLPLFVMDTLGTWPGLPGLFVAGIFSGALSTVSSGMNSLAAITLEDFVRGVYDPHMSEERATIVSKLLSLFFGILTFALVFVAEQLGSVLSAALSIFGIIGGPNLGVFTLGMLFPRANAKGAFVGTVFSLLVTLFIGGGFQFLKNYNIIPVTRIPSDTWTCTNLNVTVAETIENNFEDQSPLLDIFKVSYLYYSAIACFLVIIIGMIVSILTEPQDVRKLNPDTISPLAKKFWILIYKEDAIGADYEEEAPVVKNKQPPMSMGLTNMAFSRDH